MLKKKSNKHGLIATDKLIIIILVALVIVSVLIFIFKADVLKYLRNLPVFGSTNGNGNNNNIIPENCKKTADIGKPEGGILKSDEKYIYVDNKKTELFVDSDKIKLYQHFYSGRDIDVGVIENGQIKIISALLDENSESYKKYIQEGLPDIKTLKIIEGSKYFQEESILCKEEEITLPVELKDLSELMTYYSKNGNTIKNFREKQKNCGCGDDCENNANFIITYSSQNEINPLLVLALIMQESNCDKNIETETKNKDGTFDYSVGLMQVSTRYYCNNNYGLPSNKENCRNELKKSEINIRVGITILKEMKASYGNGKTFSGACIESYKQKTYTGWDAALRGYNGWSCRSGLEEQDYYVDNVNTISETLKKGISS